MTNRSSSVRAASLEPGASVDLADATPAQLDALLLPALDWPGYMVSACQDWFDPDTGEWEPGGHSVVLTGYYPYRSDAEAYARLRALCPHLLRVPFPADSIVITDRTGRVCGRYPLARPAA